VSESEAGDEAAASAGKAAVVGAMQPVISYKHNKQLVTQNMAEAPAMDAAPVAEPRAEQVAKSATASGPDNYVSAEIEEQLNNVDESGQIIDPSRSGEAVRASWVEARKAFYRRDYQQSELHYKKVIDNTEDNFDAYGELGNVYFNQGKNEQAAAAYFQAALILIDKGQDRRARSLLGLLGRLDAGKAEELKALLETKDAQ
jgi:tetratricopeptide (TPR) repeat protein